MTRRKDWLLNPFARIAGREALLAGLGIMMLSACIAWPAGTHFDGAIDIHAGSDTVPGWIYFAEPLVAWGCTTAMFLLVSVVGTGRRFRVIDLAGTLALSRTPMLLAAPLGFVLPDNVDPMHPGAGMLLSAIPLLVISVWTIILMFHAFRVSVNPKSGRAGWLFALALVLAEMLSKPAIYLVYQSVS
jgi:hypothetical protein